MDPMAFNGSIGDGTPASSGYGFGSQTAPRDALMGVNDASIVSTSSSLGITTTTQDYYGYTSYTNPTNPYVYSSADYQNYYYGYQQPPTDSSAPQLGAKNNSGAPYQALNSFQHSGSSVGSTSYSGTYYNAGDHQTIAGYQSNSYNNQNNMWTGGSFGSYSAQHYPNYATSDASSTQSTSSILGNNAHYQYNQWPTYYSQPTSSVSYAPGTENSAPNPPVQGVSGGYLYANNQPPPPGTTAWRRDSGSSQLPSLQGSNEVTVCNHNSAPEAVNPGSQNQQINQIPAYSQKPLDMNAVGQQMSLDTNHNNTRQVGNTGLQNQQTNQASPYFQKSLDTNPLSTNCEDRPKETFTQGSGIQLSSTNQVSEKFHTPLQTMPMVDTRRSNIMQIPTNPRITSSLALSFPKAEKEIAVNSATSRPVYIGVSMPKLNNKAPSHDDPDAIIKGTFPSSLRTYVERTFTRCKDDAQRAANQKIMKEMITKASDDGTLFTKNWDLEPLFPLLTAILDKADTNNTLNAGAAFSLPTYKRSRTRCSKSRWEPISEERLLEKPISAIDESTKYVGWNQFLGTAERVAANGRCDPKDNGWSGAKFYASLQQNCSSKIVQRPAKKPCFGDTDITENANASSDSDKEQGLTKYYSSAIALANSPEERKKREHRSKRFEKGRGHQVDHKSLNQKIGGAGNLYTRRAGAFMLAKSNDNSCSRAVEDIDWDALTVRGTCQEIEKRYLRLTSAPDPATVRPEDVLEKALEMVQASEKNYLYKCDQLKSIRQDLTVQRIQNEITVKVYETHARLALEAGDLPEYNQCQSQLKSLYTEGIKGSHMEFSAYHLLCMMLHSNSKRDLLSSMTRLSAEAKENDAVKHALAVRRAVLSGNYIWFFRLYKAAPNLNTCLMDLYMEKMRFEAVRCMSKSYRPTVPMSYISQVLGFISKTLVEESAVKHVDGLVECEEWLRAHGAILTPDNNGELHMDAKVTSSSLYMPEPDDAVAHGDANLAVDDFLTRTV